jgi:hypothetical protein
MQILFPIPKRHHWRERRKGDHTYFSSDHHIRPEKSSSLNVKKNDENPNKK